MIINRPYEALDNETNKAMQKIIIRYIKKIGLEIEVMSVFTMAVIVDTACGKHFSINISDCSRLTNRNISDYFYMKTTVNGKQKRIPKNEW